MIPECGFAVELKVSVYLEEMEMRANLYGTVAGIAHLEADGAPADIILDVAVGQDNASDRDRLCGCERGSVGISDLRLALICALERGIGVFRRILPLGC